MSTAIADAFDSQARRVEPPWLSGIAFLAALLALTAGAWALDARLLDGVSVWAKPLKFDLSILVHLLTLMLCARLLPKPVREGRLLQALALATVASAVFEIGYISLQAAAQQHSHFNDGTPFHAAMYALMGLGAVTLVAVAAAIGGLVARQAPLPPVLRHAVAIGLIGGATLTLVIAGTMSSGTSHLVGTESPGAPTLAFFGWSLTVGDLRPAHFVATHMMQALPLFGLGLATIGRPSAVWPVWLLGTAWSAAALALFAQALAGLPILAL